MSEYNRGWPTINQFRSLCGDKQTTEYSEHNNEMQITTKADYASETSDKGLINIE